MDLGSYLDSLAALGQAGLHPVSSLLSISDVTTAHSTTPAVLLRKATRIPGCSSSSLKTETDVAQQVEEEPEERSGGWCTQTAVWCVLVLMLY